MEQLALFLEISKQEYKKIQREIAKALFNYRALKVHMINQEEYATENISSPFVEARN